MKVKNMPECFYYSDFIFITPYDKNNNLVNITTHLEVGYNKGNYNIERNSILLIKSRDYYEPIYYLSGDGKSAISQCIFKNNREEINKLFEIAFNGCKNTDIIDWILDVKKNIINNIKE
jgi:hypothetical protein